MVDDCEKLLVRERVAAWVVLFCVAGGSLLVYCAAKGWVDLTYVFGVCGFKQTYGLPCPGCGVTTAAKLFFSGHIFSAFYEQPAGAVFCCAWLALGAFSFLTAVFGVRFGFLAFANLGRTIKYVVVVGLIVFVCGWAVTLARAFADK